VVAVARPRSGGKSGPARWTVQSSEVESRLPVQRSSVGCAALASLLNSREATQATHTHLQGAWCIAMRGRNKIVSYAAFRPNALYRPGVLQDEFLALVRRARWARGRLASEAHGGGNPWGIVWKRLGLKAG
jgi:hypothetical protein